MLGTSVRGFPISKRELIWSGGGGTISLFAGMQPLASFKGGEMLRALNQLFLLED